MERRPETRRQQNYPHRPIATLRASRHYKRLQKLSGELWENAGGGVGLKRCALCPKSMNSKCSSTNQGAKSSEIRRCKYCAEAEERLDEDLWKEDKEREDNEEEEYEQGYP
jgi:hypothetical protein